MGSDVLLILYEDAQKFPDIMEEKPLLSDCNRELGISEYPFITKS
jgi:hypothetical protein